MNDTHARQSLSRTYRAAGVSLRLYRCAHDAISSRVSTRRTERTDESVDRVTREREAMARRAPRIAHDVGKPAESRALAAIALAVAFALAAPIAGCAGAPARVAIIGVDFPLAADDQLDRAAYHGAVLAMLDANASSAGVTCRLQPFRLGALERAVARTEADPHARGDDDRARRSAALMGLERAAASPAVVAVVAGSEAVAAARRVSLHLRGRLPVVSASLERGADALGALDGHRFAAELTGAQRRELAAFRSRYALTFRETPTVIAARYYLATSALITVLRLAAARNGESLPSRDELSRELDAAPIVPSIIGPLRLAHVEGRTGIAVTVLGTDDRRRNGELPFVGSPL